ncbi:WD40 repeat-like protein [Suillus decipiens]|nr:WD40 repeat-like protein [Suillus decipiens]
MKEQLPECKTAITCALPPQTPVPMPTSTITVTKQTTLEYTVTQRITELSETHHDSISAAVLPNRQHMVTSLDKTLYLSHLTTRKVLKHLVGHPTDVSGLAVSRDESFIASCDTTGGIIIWNGETGVCLLNHVRGTGGQLVEITHVTHQNGHTNGTAHAHESVALYLIAAYDANDVKGHPISLDFSADGKTLAAAGGRMVKFWSTATWKGIDVIIALDAVVHCIRYSHSGNRLAIATKDHIHIYDAISHQRVKILKGNSGGSFTLAWTHDGAYLLSGGGRYDPTIRVWDVSKGDEIEVFHGHINKINAISVNDSNTMITSASCDGSFRLWPFPKSKILDVSAGAFFASFFSGGSEQKVSQWIVPTGLVSTKTEVKVIDKQKKYTFTAEMEVTVRTALCTMGGDLTGALDILTKKIKENTRSYTCFGYRSIVYARTRQWALALKDAIESIEIHKWSIGYVFKGIAHYGMGQIHEGGIAFDLALSLAARDSVSYLLLFLIKAIAIFNANAHEEAMKCIDVVAEVSSDTDLVMCKVVQIYFYAEMALAASKANIREKAIKYIDAAIRIVDDIAYYHSLKKMDFSMYTEFVVMFGWDLESLWLTVRKYKCLILVRTCNVESLEYYRSLMQECDEAQKTSLRLWFAEFKGVGCMSMSSSQSVVVVKN